MRNGTRLLDISDESADGSQALQNGTTDCDMIIGPFSNDSHSVLTVRIDRRLMNVLLSREISLFALWELLLGFLPSSRLACSTGVIVPARRRVILLFVEKIATLSLYGVPCTGAVRERTRWEEGTM